MGVAGPNPTLTDREREILLLMAKGASNSEIARLLSLSSKTVANYVSNILHKLQVADRKEAADAMAEAMGAARGGVYTDDENMTVSQWMERWLDRCTR